MLPLPDTQAAFAKALLDPQLPVPPHLRSLGAPAGEDRFAVYRNNVMVALTEGLRDAYPVVCRLVGDEFFRAMAGIFARSHPPRSPVMLEYGDGFAEFIAGSLRRRMFRISPMWRGSNAPGSKPTTPPMRNR